MKVLTQLKICTGLVLTAMITVSIPVYADTVELTFEKGEYCGSYGTDNVDTKIVLQLRAKQKLVIGVYDAYVDSAIDSQGNVLEDEGGEIVWVYQTVTSGKHFVNIKNDEGEYESFDFCVF